MAGLEADTSSYPKPGLPVSPLDTVKNLAGLQQQKQQIESGGLVINKQKLDLISQQFGVMNNELSNLIDSNATKPQAAERMARIAKTLNLPPEVSSHMMEELQQAPDVKSFALNAIRRGMDTMQKYGVQLGTPENQTDNSTVYQGNRQSAEKGGGFVPSTQMPVQVPPTQPNVNTQRGPNYLQPGIVGPSGPPGVVPVPRPAPNRLPVEQPSMPSAAAPIAPPASFGQRFAGDSRIATGAPPGVASAIEAVGGQSGKDYAADLTRAKNFKADLYPAEAALEGIKELGPQGVGPGTDALNNIKSAIITWLPNPDKEAIDKVGTFEQTRKYLTQIARSSGSTGTNDQLAAAFEANPSIKMSQAATENVLKSVIALRKMQHAQTLLAEQQGIQPDQYSKWISRNQNQFDARAFGVDYMTDEARKKLYESLKKDPKAYQKFEKTLQFAHDSELVGN